MKVTNISNLRDIGGYKGYKGLTVKNKVIYRSGELSPLGVNATEHLVALGIGKVYDLRTKEEVIKTPNILDDRIINEHRPVYDSLKDILSKLNVTLPTQIDIKDATSAPLPPEKMMLLRDLPYKMYRDMVENPEVFSDIIEDMLLNQGQPLLFHCTAGKDRTGVLAALIMLALGVDRADVKDNYLLSNEYRREEIEKELAGVSKKIQDKELLANAKNMLGVHESFIDTVFDVIDFHGGFDSYAKTKLKLSQDSLDRLRDLYLK